MPNDESSNCSFQLPSVWLLSTYTRWWHPPSRETKISQNRTNPKSVTCHSEGWRRIPSWKDGPRRRSYTCSLALWNQHYVLNNRACRASLTPPHIRNSKFTEEFEFGMRHQTGQGATNQRDLDEDLDPINDAESSSPLKFIVNKSERVA
jgi:hypothetical protein